MVSQPLPNPEQSDTDPLEAAADQAIATCGGDPREAVKALIVAFEAIAGTVRVHGFVSVI